MPEWFQYLILVIFLKEKTDQWPKWNTEIHFQYIFECVCARVTWFCKEGWHQITPSMKVHVQTLGTGRRRGRYTRECFPALSKHSEADIHSCRFYKYCASITHADTHTLPVSLPTYTHTHTLRPGFGATGPEVRGERLWERRGPVAWNCHCPDKLVSNINKHTYTSLGQCSRERSTIPPTPLERSWNNTAHAETTPGRGLSQHGTRQKLEATPLGKQHHTMLAMGNNPSGADAANFMSQSVGSLQGGPRCTDVDEPLCGWERVLGHEIFGFTCC